MLMDYGKFFLEPSPNWLIALFSVRMIFVLAIAPFFDISEGFELFIFAYFHTCVYMWNFFLPFVT